MAASGTLRRPGRPGTQAHSALGAQRRAPSAERVARGGDRARRMRRARSAHATGAERVARGGVSCELACWRSQHTDTLGGFCLLAHNSNIVGGLNQDYCHQHLAVGPLFEVCYARERRAPLPAPPRHAQLRGPVRGGRRKTQRPGSSATTSTDLLGQACDRGCSDCIPGAQQHHDPFSR